MLKNLEVEDFICIFVENNLKIYIMKITGIIVLIIVIVMFVPWIVMLLWNGLMVDLFSVKTITYWQSVGLWMLCNLLFNSGYNNEK